MRYARCALRGLGGAPVNPNVRLQVEASLKYILVFAFVVAVAVVPVILAARFVGAGRSGFGSTLIAVIMQSALSSATRALAPSLGVALLVAIVAGSAIYAFVLDTTLIRGFLIGVVSTVIGVVVLLIFGSLLAAGTNAI